MKLFRLLCAFAAALLLPLALASPAQAQRDWTKTVVATGEGGFRMGNPAARVRIVEFVSLTCPHCRAFSINGAPSLIQRYVRSGQASFEIRSFVVNPFDAAAAVLNRCAAPQNYFALNDAFLAEQPQWLGRLAQLTDRQVDELDRLSETEQLVRIAAIAGLERIAARHGVTPARARACLTDRNNLVRIAGVKQNGERLGVDGTPSFLVNGRLARGVHDWTQLEPLLRLRR